MVFSLIIIWEQHDGQNPSPVTRAPQTLDKTRDFTLDHRPTFRPNPVGCQQLKDS